MANIAPGLNFKIGADVKGINKAIREAEKSLRGAVSTFSSIGNSLSLALSAPILAFGAASLKAAGDIESLKMAMEGTMKDAGRSVGEARAELEALRIAALAPGLDFEQAVKGSIRLQSVGKSAEEAREIIIQLANALALSGGTADQLDGVTKQFTQMIGKGKIMQEDLSIILENMPVLAKVMQDTFGTSNAEMLRKAGVSVEDFISGLTQGMTKLERAQGGIANAIVNATNAMKQGLASLGEELDKTFNISGALNSFGEWVQNLAIWFKGLDESTKRVIGAVAVFAVTLGPAFKLMQGGVWIVGQLQLAFLGLQKVLAQSMAGQAIPSLMAKWRAMDLMMKTSVIGATVAVVLALAAAFTVLQKDMSATAQAARQVEQVSKSAQESIVSETTKTGLLLDVIKDNKKGYDEKRAALEELQKISPEYFGNLDKEKIKVTDVEEANNRYIGSLMRAATARAALTQIEENARARLKLGETADPTMWQTAVNAMKSLGNASMFAGNQVKSAITNYEEQKAALEASDEAMKKVIEENTSIVEVTKKTTGAVQENTKAVQANETAIRKAFEAMKMPVLAKTEQAQPTLSPIFDAEGMNAALVSASTVGAGIVTAMTPVQALLQSLTTETLTFGEAFEVVATSMAENGSIFQQVGWGIASAMEQVAASGGGFKEMADGILQNLKKVIGGLIKTGVTAVVTKALLTSALNPFAALALGAASGALAQGLFNSLINKIKIPQLAEGGVLTGPQLVMAGEYSGAKHNPEIVTPENKMRDVFAEVMRSQGGTNGGTLSVRVSGDDLLFILDKAEKKAGRKR